MPASVRRIVWVDWARDFRPRQSKLGEAKVEHLDEAVGPEHDVLGLHVTMHDSRSMRDTQGGRRLNRDVEGVVDADA